jgi:hypothetical protein
VVAGRINRAALAGAPGDVPTKHGGETPLMLARRTNNRHVGYRARFVCGMPITQRVFAVLHRATIEVLERWYAQKKMTRGGAADKEDGSL